MVKKLTEKKINTMLQKVWDGGFKLPSSYIRKARIDDCLMKMDRYKTEKARISYQRRTFGIGEGDLLRLRDLIILIKRLIDIEK